MTHLFKNVEDLIQERIGIDTQITGSDSLQHFIVRRMETLGVQSYEDYYELLVGNTDEFQSLVDLVTIPETWFFRDASPFSYLKKYVAEHWLPRCGELKLSALSLPCSSGEEPYSIAMSLLDCGLLAEQFHVDAFDINKRSLEKAVNAIYSANSFRGGSLEFQDKYFTRVDGNYQLNKDVRERVSFHHGNALNILNEAQGQLYDIIFCRNLMIYYDRSRQEALLAQLKRLLLPQGRLFLGHADSSDLVLSMFSGVGGSGSFAFELRRAGDEWLNPEIFAGAMAATPAGTNRKTPRVKQATKPRTSALKRKVLKVQETDNTLISDIEKKADSGDLDAAAQLCELLVQQDIADADALCLCGVINELKGDAERAGGLFRRAIYLNPLHYQATVHLAENLESQGLAEEAALLRARAKEIASGSHGE